MQLPGKQSTGRQGEIEDSLSLRLITSAMAVVGILAACQLAETPLALVVLGIAGIIAGSVVSYRRRRANNFWLKWCISLGILVVAGVFFQELLERIRASVADARMPLTNMLIGLQALHCFDMPRRRDLNLSALVGLTLMASAATLSRDTGFGIYLATFIVLSSYMLHLDCISRTKSRALLAVGQPAEARAHLIASVLLLPLFGFLVFLIMPRAEITLLRHISVSAKLDLPWLKGDSVVNKNLGHDLRADGSIAINPQAYFGFAEDLDLNYRGQLGDEIVMRVASQRGQFWRAMAFDTYDGHHWTMSQPKKTEERLAYCGTEIPLSPLPSFLTVPGVRAFNLNQVFYIEADQPNIVPAASVPYLLQFPAQMVKVDQYGGIRCASALEKDTVYTVLSKVPLFDLSRLRKAPIDSPSHLKTLTSASGMSCYLQLPSGLPGAVRVLAEKVGGRQGNWFVQAERINNFLQSAYTYDLNIPATPQANDVVADFLLAQKRGYCEHFASSFVVLCRCRGIPARLVTGFCAGDYNPLTGLWEVKMKQAHAWAEVFIPRAGWVSFDPTAQGVGPGFPGYEKQSVIDYIIEQLRPWLELLWQQPALKAAGNALAGFMSLLLNIISPALLFLTTFWKQLTAAGAIALAISYIFASKPRWWRALLLRVRRQAKEQAGTTAGSEDFFRRQATSCYENVLKDLRLLAVTRLAGDTTGDLRQTLAARLSELASGSEPPEAMREQSRQARLELMQDLEHFMEQYDRARFGNNSQVRELPDKALALHAKIKQVASQAQLQDRRKSRIQSAKPVASAPDSLQSEQRRK